MGQMKSIHAPVRWSARPDVGDDQRPRLGGVERGAAPHREAEAVLLLLQQDGHRAGHHAAAALHGCRGERRHDETTSAQRLVLVEPDCRDRFCVGFRGFFIPQRSVPQSQHLSLLLVCYL